MARPEVTGRRPFGEADAYSIEEFCERHRISVALYYKLKRLGHGPVEFSAGTRKLISREAGAAWRRQRETVEAS